MKGKGRRGFGRSKLGGNGIRLRRNRIRVITNGGNTRDNRQSRTRVEMTEALASGESRGNSAWKHDTWKCHRRRPAKLSSRPHNKRKPRRNKQR